MRRGWCTPNGATSAPPVGVVHALAFFGVTEVAPGVGMHHPLRIQLLDDVVRIVELVRPIIEVVARHDRDLASQLRRALSSVGLNIAEAYGSKAGHRRIRFESARGSLYEAAAGLRIAVAWGYTGADSTRPSLAAIDHLGARLYRIAHP